MGPPQLKRQPLGGYQVAMIDPTDSESSLRQLLREEGFIADDPALAPIWSAYRRFVRVPVRCADDNFLCQWGTYSGAPDAFEFDITRQFAIEEDGEHTGLQQLHCTLIFPKSVGANLNSGNTWASEHPSLDAFLTHVASLPAFAAATQAGIARSSLIHFEDV